MNASHANTTGPSSRPGLLRAVGAGALLTVLAACGSAGYGTGAAGTSAGAAGTAIPGQPSSSAAGQTITMRNTAGITGVLADPQGHTLYVSDQESGGKVLCGSGCVAIWMPLTVPAGQQPSGPASIMSDLTTITRPDGTTQVALDGKPLYTFALDGGVGQVRGNGTKDSFGDAHFTWHVATASGPAGQAPSASGSSGSGGYGGYGYGSSSSGSGSSGSGSGGSGGAGGYGYGGGQ